MNVSSRESGNSDSRSENTVRAGHREIMDSSVVLRYQLVHANAKAPLRSTEGSAGFDLYAVEDGVIGSKMVAARTGLVMALPPGHRGQIYSRSGLSLKYGLQVGAGVIDWDYRGELKVILHCVGGTEAPTQDGNYRYEDGEYRYYYKAGERIAQIVIVRDPTVVMEEAEGLKDEKTAHTGFGSTGRF